MEQVESLGQGGVKLAVLSGILAQIDLRLAVAGITVVLAAAEEIGQRLVVMLVDDGHAKLVGQLPPVLEVGVAGMGARAGRANDDNLGMRLGYALIDVLEALAELGRDAFLVAEAQILQAEGSGMSGVGTHLCPLVGGGVSVGPFDEVDGLSYPLVHLGHRHHVLRLVLHAPAAIGSLTADAAGQDGDGSHSQVLAELEILVVTQAHALVIAPAVLQAPARLLGTDGRLPAVSVPEAVASAMDDTAAREAHELRMEVGQRLNQVFAETVALVGVLWHQRYHIDIEVARRQHQHLQRSFCAGLRRSEDGRIFLPGLVAHVNYGLSQELRVFAPFSGLHENDANLLGRADVAHENREIILLSGLHADAVEAVVLDSESFPALVVVVLLHPFGVETHIGRIVGVEGVVLAHINRTKGMSGTCDAPGGAGTPAVAFGRAVFERAVLHQFGVDAAVGSMADVLEEDAKQFVTNHFAALGRLHRLCGNRVCQDSQ